MDLIWTANNHVQLPMNVGLIEQRFFKKKSIRHKRHEKIEWFFFNVANNLNICKYIRKLNINESRGFWICIIHTRHESCLRIIRCMEIRGKAANILLQLLIEIRAIGILIIIDVHNSSHTFENRDNFKIQKKKCWVLFYKIQKFGKFL